MAHPQWRLLFSPPASGPENMALDEALMTRARETGEWVFRIYTWASPTVSLGRNQTARDRYDLNRIRDRGFAIVRRPTGGRAILHHREVTYSVTAPEAAAGDLRVSYARINRVLLDGLRTLGVDAEIANPPIRAGMPGMAPCFDEPSAGELTVDGRKLAGSAQWRSEGGLLQHGSILLADDQSTLAELSIVPQRRVPPPATLTDALGAAPSMDAMIGAFGDAVRKLEDPAATVLEIDSELRARTQALVVRYLDDEWTWRR